MPRLTASTRSPVVAQRAGGDDLRRDAAREALLAVAGDERGEVGLGVLVDDVAAVSVCALSMRMSSGASSAQYEKPRTGRSSCGLLTPRSNRIPTIPSLPCRSPRCRRLARSRPARCGPAPRRVRAPRPPPPPRRDPGRCRGAGGRVGRSRIARRGHRHRRWRRRPARRERGRAGRPPPPPSPVVSEASTTRSATVARSRARRLPGTATSPPDASTKAKRAEGALAPRRPGGWWRARQGSPCQGGSASDPELRQVVGVGRVPAHPPGRARASGRGPRSRSGRTRPRPPPRGRGRRNSRRFCGIATRPCLSGLISLAPLKKARAALSSFAPRFDCSRTWLATFSNSSGVNTERQPPRPLVTKRALRELIPVLRREDHPPLRVQGVLELPQEHPDPSPLAPRPPLPGHCRAVTSRSTTTLGHHFTPFRGTLHPSPPLIQPSPLPFPPRGAPGTEARPRRASAVGHSAAARRRATAGVAERAAKPPSERVRRGPSGRRRRRLRAGR